MHLLMKPMRLLKLYALSMGSDVSGRSVKLYGVPCVARVSKCAAFKSQSSRGGLEKGKVWNGERH